MSPNLPFHNPETSVPPGEEAPKDSTQPSFPEGDFLKRQYWGGEPFRSIVESSAKKVEGGPAKKPEEKIPYFLDRLEAVLQDREGRSRNESFARRIYSHFVIEPENIPEDYFRTVLLGNFAEMRGYQREDLENSQIRAQIKNQFQQETGHNIDTYEIPEDQREELTEQIVNDQKRSFDVWLSYLTSPDAENYPRALRYWALAEAVKLGPYDPDRRKFSKREENTVAPFPELNPQALTLVFDFISKKYAQEPLSLPDLSEEQEERLKKAIASESFASLYAWSLEYVRSLRLPEERLTETRGEWRVFPRGSDPKLLTQQLQGFSTGWCIAAEGTAQSYLARSDIHIFYSLDEEGKPTIPRAAIVTDGQTISEVRGIADSQNLDTYITPTVDSRLKQMPGGEEWQEQMEDMRTLASIYIKYLRREELSTDELRFLYEIDKPIKSLGYQKDPRIGEILTGRDIRTDLALIFDCSIEQISLTRKEALRGDIKYHHGGLDLPRLTSAKGLHLPREVGGDLNLSGLTSAEGLYLPERIGGGLYLLGLTSAEGLHLPERIGGNLDLRCLTSAEGLRLPREVRGYLDLSGLTSAEGLYLPERIGGGLYLLGLTSAEGLYLPERIGGNLDLRCLTSAEGLRLPREVRGYLDLSGLTSAEGLHLPEKIGGIIRLDGLSSQEIEKLKQEYPHLKFCK